MGRVGVNPDLRGFAEGQARRIKGNEQDAVGGIMDRGKGK